MNPIDLCLAGLLAFGAYKGYKMGLAVILINTIALVAAVVVGVRFLDIATEVLGNQISANKLILPILAFGLLFGITYFGLRWFGQITSKSIRYTMIGTLDQAVGSVFGLFRMAFILSSVAFGLQMLGVEIKPSQTETMIIFPALVKLGPACFKFLAPLLPFLKKLL